jgi:dienelactone hydrolase
MTLRILCLGAAMALGTSAAAAAVVEEIISISVEVVDRHRKTVKQPITVTMFRDDTRAKAPFLVLNHGRTLRADERAKMDRVRFPGNANYFVANGFTVFIPTRIGYGVSGGPDVEDAGACNLRDDAPAFEVAAQQTLAVIRHARTLAHVDADKGLVVGQSFGGAVAVAVAAKSEPGVVGAVNFAGGAGGRPKTHPGQPCRADFIARALAGYGKSARVPTLWLYSQNDRFWGAKLPKDWFDGFVNNGGRGRFVALPAYGDDGHVSFSRHPAAWRPAFQDFVRDHLSAPAR